MTNEKMKGIKIPEECGKAEKYALTAIMYHDENVDAEMKECAVFITEEDYQDNKIFVTVSGNKNPTLLMFPDEYNIGIGYLEYDLVEAGLTRPYRDDGYAVVVSKVVNAADTVWSNSNVDRASYLTVKPKIVIETKDGITEEE